MRGFLIVASPFWLASAVIAYPVCPSLISTIVGSVIAAGAILQVVHWVNRQDEPNSKLPLDPP
jgi:hypothetical protein